MLARFVAFLVLVSLIVGFSSNRSRLRADPDACPQYECRTVHAYWNGVQKDFVWGIFVQDGNDNADNGIEDIFTTSSVEKKPLDLFGTESVDYWTYAACTPFCGKDANGKWQAAQEVLTSGTYGKLGADFIRTPWSSPRKMESKLRVFRVVGPLVLDRGQEPQ